MVKPIMRKRDWKVGTLAEFLPNNPALQGKTPSLTPEMETDFVRT